MSERDRMVFEALRRRRASVRLVPVLIAVLLALVPLAHASPPDQTWFSGLYDNSDYDDVVLLVTSTVAALEHYPTTLDATSLTVVGFVGSISILVPPSAVPAPYQGRGPPRS